MNPAKEEFTYQILNLTEQFYADYPAPPYNEILKKKQRPYNCLLIQSRSGYFICIPYRTHINHKHAYKFKNSVRSRANQSGLDFSKMVIVTRSDYLGTADVILDKDEFNETVINIERIKNGAQEYIDKYLGYFDKKEEAQDKRKFQRMYGFSTLKYFHKELGLEEK